MSNVEPPYVYDNDLNAFLREGDVVAIRGYNTHGQGLVLSVNEDSGRVPVMFCLTKTPSKLPRIIIRAQYRVIE